MKYKFKAKNLKTGEWVEGDLAYVHQWLKNRTTRIKPMIVTHHASGGMVYLSSRYLIDENTIELIKEE